jgi:hypothetical protein
MSNPLIEYSNQNKATKQQIKEYRKIPYCDYLKTEHWQLAKNAVRYKYKNKCTKCGSNKSLEVHHLSYKNFGREELKDLTLLCSNCHILAHCKIKEEPKVITNIVVKKSPFYSNNKWESNMRYLNDILTQLPIDESQAFMDKMIIKAQELRKIVNKKATH